MRKSQFKDYFKPPKTAPARKGRSSELITRRDNKLAARFYFYCEIKKISYADTITRLSQEFDIAEKVVLDRLRINQEELDRVFNERPNPAKLRKEIPFLNWN